MGSAGQGRSGAEKRFLPELDLVPRFGPVPLRKLVSLRNTDEELPRLPLARFCSCEETVGRGGNADSRAGA